METWEHNGIESSGPKPWLLGKYEDRKVSGCIILGCSKAVWDEYHEASKLFENKDEYEVMAINDIGIQFKAEHVEHIVSVHQQMPGPIRDLRMVRIQNHPYTHSRKPHKGVDFVWPDLMKNGGTSGLFAVKIALAMGYKKIIVCGCGLDMTGHYYDPEIPEDNINGWFDKACQEPWEDLHKKNPEAKKRVRIMSGALSNVYQKPDAGWIYGKTVGV